MKTKLKTGVFIAAVLLLSEIASAQTHEPDAHGAAVSTAAKSKTEIEIKGRQVSSIASLKANAETDRKNIQAEEANKKALRHLKERQASKRAEVKSELKANAEARKEALASIRSDLKTDLQTSHEEMRSASMAVKHDSKTAKKTITNTLKAEKTKPDVKGKGHIKAKTKLQLQPNNTAARIRTAGSLRVL